MAVVDNNCDGGECDDDIDNYINSHCIIMVMITTASFIRVSSGQGKVREIPDQAKVRELSGNFVMGQGKLKMLWKVREFWRGHGYGGFMSNLKHFGQHPHSLLMELLASVTWMSSSYDSLDISLMSDKLIYNFPSNYTWKLFSSHETERVWHPLPPELLHCCYY